MPQPRHHDDRIANSPAERLLASANGSAAASKPPRPFYTGNWLKCCDRCEHAEPHYCLLYSRPMKNMDVKRCRDWQERQNDKLTDIATR